MTGHRSLEQRPPGVGVAILLGLVCLVTIWLPVALIVVVLR
ncbi:MAG: hypothetical protein U5R31_02950 [Acidimicrobiia bacterium]|nr:hypothetical protein [Acidimicrobiia bacterium]